MQRTLEKAAIETNRNSVETREGQIRTSARQHYKEDNRKKKRRVLDDEDEYVDEEEEDRERRDPDCDGEDVHAHADQSVTPHITDASRSALPS